MAIKLHPDGGFICTRNVAGGQLETRLTWRNHHNGIAVEVTGGGNSTSLVTMLADILGGGLHVEFDQSLLGAEPGCATPRDATEVFRHRLGDLSAEILNIGDKLGLDIPTDANTSDKAFEIVRHALLQIGEQVTGANAAELRPLDKTPEPPAHFKDTVAEPPKTPTIAGVSVGEASGDPPRRKRRTKAEMEADAAKAEAEREAVRNQPKTPSQPTKPDPAATEAFKAEMEGAARKIDALPKASVVEVKPAAAQQPEPHVEPTGDALDEAVTLLSTPPMPVDLHPLDSKRNQSDQQYLDTAQIRLYFGYPLVEEYAKDPKFRPGNPPAPQVNLMTDEGVVAAVQWMAAIHERAGKRGIAIPQLDLFFGLGTIEEVIEGAVVKCRARREARAAQLVAQAGR